MNFEQKLYLAAEEWLKLRTPFSVRGSSRKYGVDCVHLAHALYVEAGVDLPPIPRDYFIDESRHNRTDKLIQWIDQSGFFEEIPIAETYPAGTMLCAEIGLAPYHVAVVFDQSRAIHSVRRSGVCAVSYGDATFKSIIKAYRVKR